MKVKLFSLFLILALISLGACSKKSAEKAEKKEAPKKVAGGFVINFKPNDSLDLVPAKTVILQPGGNEGANNFCLDVVAKSIDQVSQVSFDLTFDPALITYRSFKPGTLFEEKGKVDYKIGVKGDDKGKLAGKIGFESGGPAGGTHPGGVGPAGAGPPGPAAFHGAWVFVVDASALARLAADTILFVLVSTI